jgi:hypothetical protein
LHLAVASIDDLIAMKRASSRIVIADEQRKLAGGDQAE